MQLQPLQNRRFLEWQRPGKESYAQVKTCARLLLALNSAVAFAPHQPWLCPNAGRAVHEGKGERVSLVPVSFRCSQTLRAQLVPPDDTEIDTTVALADAAIIFAFSFFKAIVDIGDPLSEWFTPIRVNPLRLDSVLGFANGWIVCWLAAGLVTSAWPPFSKRDEDSIQRLGFAGALKTFVLATAMRYSSSFLASLLVGMSPDALPSPLQLQLTVDGVATTALLCATMLSWRSTLAARTRYW